MCSFKDKKSYKKFSQSPAYVTLKSTCASKFLLKTPQNDELLDFCSGFSYRPSKPDTSIDPFIVIGTILYEPGTRDAGVKHWKDVTDAVEKEEENTLTYCFLKNRERGNALHSFKRYKTKQYFQKVHCTSEAIKVNIERQGEIMTKGGLSHRFWKQVESSREEV
jgi:hypothetical protein